MKDWLRRWLLGFSSRLYVLALARSIEIERAEYVEQATEYEVAPWSRAEIERLAWREISSIRESIISHFDYQDREVRILSDRLTRRYDLGMALNEAANRAIDAKKVQLGASYPTPKQQIALDLQAKTLQQRLKDTR